ncbi:hypothetical protein LB577_27265 [Mesorhizobium sp. B283B1A]|uniref:hypothetical protein n=1 Tax=Mesorhizobium TaxID=68287 RepID=UPI001CD083CC|nr:MULTISPECIES: hypothetical protein [Mesorhizobium]MCA0050608.1 hypothetical protein [Mesorhizobium sp. B283B1A]UQS65290.1 hypothetical protein M5D98_02640 [Mesorhizobium opportunistum]
MTAYAIFEPFKVYGLVALIFLRHALSIDAVRPPSGEARVGALSREDVVLARHRRHRRRLH